MKKLLLLITALFLTLTLSACQSYSQDLAEAIDKLDQIEEDLVWDPSMFEDETIIGDGSASVIITELDDHVNISVLFVADDRGAFLDVDYTLDGDDLVIIFVGIEYFNLDTEKYIAIAYEGSHISNATEKILIADISDMDIDDLLTLITDIGVLD